MPEGSHTQEYVLTLKDLFTGKVKNAEGAAQALDGTMHQAASSASNLGMQLAGAIGVTVAFAGAIEMIRDGKEAWEQLERANSQLEAGLASTGGVAGMTMEALGTMSDEMSHSFKFTKAEIADMQAIMLTFPKVTKDTFGEASQAVIDMATRMHKGIDETAVMVGKALQDPERGVIALRRVGVNFDAEQTKILKNLVATGHAAEAQAMILKELNTEFGGSAAGAAQADAGFRFHKSLEELELSIGQVADELERWLAPALEGFVDLMKSAFTWMKENKDLLYAIGVGATVAATAWGVYTIAINAAAWATKIWTAAQWLLNVAMDANPIGLLIVGIGAVVAAIVYAYKEFAQFRAVLWGVWSAIKEWASLVKEAFTGLYEIIHGAFTLNPSEVAGGLLKLTSTVKNAGKNIGDAFVTGYNDGLTDFFKDKTGTVGAPKQGKAGKPGAAAGTTPPKTETAKAMGSKAVTINIKIDNLVREFQVRTTNITESASKAKELVTQALLSAVNDSQIVAGQ